MHHLEGRYSWSAALALVFAFVLSGPASAVTPTAADAAGQCKTPQQAVYQLLYWLQPERSDATKAAACLSRSGLDDPSADASRLAVKLKRVLDGRALYVPVNDLPAQPDYTDETSGEHRFVLFPAALPNIIVTLEDGRWVFPAGSLAQVPELYAETYPFTFDDFVAELPEWMQAPLLGVSVWQILGVILLILIAMILQRIVVLLVSRWMRRLADRIDAPWVASAVTAASRPLGGLALAAVLGLGVPLLQFPVTLNKVLLLGIRTLASFSVVWLAFRLIDVASDVFAKRAEKTETKLDDQLVPLVRRAGQVTVATLGTLFILQNLDVDVGSLLAGVGLGGLAFALAAQDTVKNLFGSLMIFIDKPFQVGDWIKIDGSVEGTVEEVGFRSTRIRTFYSSVISVPNGLVADKPIDNLGVRQYRRYKTTIGLTYDTPPAKLTAFCEGVRALIQAIDGMRKDFDLVEFTEFGPVSLDILVYSFLDTEDWAAELRTRHNFNLGMLQLAKDLGVDFAFPTQTIHVETVPHATEAAGRHGEGLSEAEVIQLAREYGPNGRRYEAMHRRASTHADKDTIARGAADG